MASMRNSFFLYIILLSACSFSPDKATILENSKFPPPSWSNINIGETSQQEMLKILETNPNVVEDSIIEIGRPWNIYDDTVDFTMYPNWLNQPATWVDTYIKDNIVVDMTFCGNLDTTLGDLVNKLGEPESVIVTRGGEVGGLVLGMIHPDNGVYYWYWTGSIPDDRRTDIYPEIKIGCLGYFDPGLYDVMLEAGLFSQGEFSGEDTLKIMYHWAGYGSIEEKYP
jgi:hypothetical protein